MSDKQTTVSATPGTGIAGAMDYHPATGGDGLRCYVCGGEFAGQYGASYAARAVHGVGVAQVCGAACAADPRFTGAGLAVRAAPQ